MLFKFLSFALIGVLGTLAHYLVLYLLVETQGCDPVIGSGYGSLTGLFINYILNFKWTFNSDRPHRQTFPKFALIALIGIGFNIGLMELLSQKLYYLYAQILTTLVVLIWNFSANTLWTFSMDKTADTSVARLALMFKKPFSVLGLILTILLIRLITLGLYPLYDPSESRYAEMARKMLETGNWVTPMIDYNIPFWGKPPLTIWLTAISLDIGGINDFSARLPSILLSLGSCWILFNLARTQRDPQYAFKTVSVLAGSLLFFVMSGTVAMDQCMSFGITLALSSFWLALHRERTYWAYAFFIGLSIGLMAKGPVTLVLSGICIGLWTLISGRWLDIWRRIPWITGTLLMLCICAPWYWLAEQKTPGFLEYFFIGEHWKRFTESGWKGDLYGVGREHTRGMIWVYWLAAGFPWTLVLLRQTWAKLALKETRKTLLSHYSDWRLYCALWMLAPLLFFSFSANIIWTYVLPGMPGLALLIGEYQLDFKKHRTLMLTGSVPMMFFCVVLFYQLTEGDFFKSQKRLVEAYQQLATPDEHLIYLKEKVYSAQFYLQGKVLELPGIEALQSSIGHPGHDYYVLRKSIADELPPASKIQLEPIKSYGKYVLYHAISR